MRGQYDGYRDVAGVDPGSTVETYVAVRTTVDSWRWAGVPIVIRAGKCLPVTATEISVRFRKPPHDVFGVGASAVTNALRFRIWPESEIRLALAGKRPGAAWQPELHELAFAQQPGSDMRPYGRGTWAPGRPTPCCPTATPGTTRPAERSPALGDPVLRRGARHGRRLPVVRHRGAEQDVLQRPVLPAHRHPQQPDRNDRAEGGAGERRHRP